MTYKNVTTQFSSGTVYEFTTDQGLKGHIIIKQIHEDKIKAHPHLKDLLDAQTIIQYPEDKYIQESRLHKDRLTYQETDALQMLIDANITAYKRAMQKTPAP